MDMLVSEMIQGGQEKLQVTGKWLIWIEKKNHTGSHAVARLPDGGLPAEYLVVGKHVRHKLVIIDASLVYLDDLHFIPCFLRVDDLFRAVIGRFFQNMQYFHGSIPLRALIRDNEIVLEQLLCHCIDADRLEPVRRVI